MATQTAPADLDIEKCERMVRGSGWFALRAMARSVAQLYDQILAPTGLRVMQLGILRVCGHHGPISVAALARELAAERSTVMRSLRPLVADGLLRRTGGGGRGKRSPLELTPKGQSALVAGIAHWEQAQRGLKEQLGEARWNRIESELSAIAKVSS